MNTIVRIVLVATIFLTLPLKAISQDIYLFDIVDRIEVPDSIFNQSRIDRFDTLISMTLPSWETRWVYYMKFRSFDLLVGSQIVTAMDWPEDPDSTTVMQFSSCRGSLRILSTGDSTYYLNCSGSQLRYFNSHMSAAFSETGSANMDWTVAPIINYAFSFDTGLQPSYGYFFQGVDSLIHPPISGTSEADNNLLKLEFHPNPVSEQLTFTLDKPTGRFYTVAIYDASGRLQHSERLVSTSIHEPLDVSFLSAGMYYVYLAPVLGKPYRASFVKL